MDDFSWNKKGIASTDEEALLQVLDEAIERLERLAPKCGAELWYIQRDVKRWKEIANEVRGKLKIDR